MHPFVHRAWMKQGKMAQIAEAFSFVSPCFFLLSYSCTESESSYTLNMLLHLKLAPTTPLLLVFLLALPNGLMDWGCIGGTQVRRDSRVIIAGLREDVWNASHCKVRTILRSSAGFIKEAARHSKMPPSLCSQTPMPIYWLIALVIILYNILRMYACVWDLIAMTFKKHWGWFKRKTHCC